MKLLAIILILCNLMLLAWLQFGQPLPEPEPTELHPDRIRIVRHTATENPASQTTPTDTTVLPPASDTVIKPAVKVAEKITENIAKTAEKTPAPATTAPSKANTSAACLEFTVTDPEQVTHIQTQLNQLHLGTRLISISPPDAKGPFWIYYPPLPNRQAADDTISKLRAQGIQDVSPVRNGPWQNALSLGLYAKASAAQDRLNKLQQAGIPAQIEAYGKASRSFELMQITPNEQTAISAIVRQSTIPHLNTIPCTTTAHTNQKQP